MSFSQNSFQFSLAVLDDCQNGAQLVLEFCFSLSLFSICFILSPLFVFISYSLSPQSFTLFSFTSFFLYSSLCPLFLCILHPVLFFSLSFSLSFFFLYSSLFPLYPSLSPFSPLSFSLSFTLTSFSLLSFSLTSFSLLSFSLTSFSLLSFSLSSFFPSILLFVLFFPSILLFVLFFPSILLFVLFFPSILLFVLFFSFILLFVPFFSFYPSLCPFFPSILLFVLFFSFILLFVLFPPLSFSLSSPILLLSPLYPFPFPPLSFSFSPLYPSPFPPLSFSFSPSILILFPLYPYPSPFPLYPSPFPPFSPTLSFSFSPPPLYPSPSLLPPLYSLCPLSFYPCLCCLSPSIIFYFIISVFPLSLSLLFFLFLSSSFSSIFIFSFYFSLLFLPFLYPFLFLFLVHSPSSFFSSQNQNRIATRPAFHQILNIVTLFRLTFSFFFLYRVPTSRIYKNSCLSPATFLNCCYSFSFFLQTNKTCPLTPQGRKQPQSLYLHSIPKPLWYSAFSVLSINI
ncbi:MCHR1 [Acanthosepion pharaonis]|uniref:MCHR1 n=1 Tax=Acanthosepion pharaonis TaxID=158019 RepID=A0A812E2A6_ACAPH|nr:MCHR1 [Sepia pharaonis]